MRQHVGAHPEHSKTLISNDVQSAEPRPGHALPHGHTLALLTAHALVEVHVQAVVPVVGEGLASITLRWLYLASTSRLRYQSFGRASSHTMPRSLPGAVAWWPLAPEMIPSPQRLVLLRDGAHPGIRALAARRSGRRCGPGARLAVPSFPRPKAVLQSGKAGTLRATCAPEHVHEPCHRIRRLRPLKQMACSTWFSHERGPAPVIQEGTGTTQSRTNRFRPDRTRITSNLNRTTGPNPDRIEPDQTGSRPLPNRTELEPNRTKTELSQFLPGYPNRGLSESCRTQAVRGSRSWFGVRSGLRLRIGVGRIRSRRASGAVLALGLPGVLGESYLLLRKS